MGGCGKGVCESQVEGGLYGYLVMILQVSIVKSDPGNCVCSATDGLLWIRISMWVGGSLCNIDPEDSYQDLA